MPQSSNLFKLRQCKISVHSRPNAFSGSKPSAVVAAGLRSRIWKCSSSAIMASGVFVTIASRWAYRRSPFVGAVLTSFIRVSWSLSGSNWGPASRPCKTSIAPGTSLCTCADLRECFGKAGYPSISRQTYNQYRGRKQCVAVFQRPAPASLAGDGYTHRQYCYCSRYHSILLPIVVRA